MLKLLLTICLLVVIHAIAPAQSSNNVPNANSIIKDSAGNVYETTAWRSALMTGHYTLRAKENPNTGNEFILVRLSEQEREQRIKSLPKPRESKSFVTGEKFSDFSAKDIAGNKYKMKDLKGKIIVLNFWFIKCAPCVQEMPDLNKIVEKFKDSANVVFLAIALDDTRSLRKFLETRSFLYPVVSDGKYLTDRFRIQSYPTHVIIDQEQKVYFHTSGLAIHTTYWIEKSINALLGKTAD